jgi:hypothetical protein
MDGLYTYNQTDAIGYRIPASCYQSLLMMVQNLPSESCPSNISLSMPSSIGGLINQTQELVNFENQLYVELTT